MDEKWKKAGEKKERIGVQRSLQEATPSAKNSKI